MDQTAITRDDIARTEALIRPHIRRTPILAVDAADFGLGSQALTFKLELMQHAGSFKSRGAFTHLLSRKIPAAGVDSCSDTCESAGKAGGAMGRPAPRQAIHHPRHSCHTNTNFRRLRPPAGPA